MAINILLTTICPQEADIQLGLYYLKAYFLKYSKYWNSVDIKVMPFSSSEEVGSIINKIYNTKPKIIGFSCYVWNVTKILKVAKTIKRQRNDIQILLGGPEASPRAYQLLNYYRFIDAVVIGEGEASFKDFLEYSISGSPGNKRRIKGIAYRQKKRIIITEKRPEIANLDDIPSPYLDGGVGIDLKSYSGYIPTETLRGCAYKCHYCYYHKEFQYLRYFSLQRVENELKFLLGKNPKGIYLMDPTFNFNRERAKKILRIFIKYNINTNLHLELKAELLDSQMIGLLHKAKTNFIEIGLQTTTQKTLKVINRSFNQALFKKNILLLNQKPISYEIQLIDGLPDENYRSFRRGIDWLFSLSPRMIRVMRFMLLPGTYLRQHARQFKIRYLHRPPYWSIESNTFSPKDLEKTRDLSIAMNLLYFNGLLKRVLCQLVEKSNLGFSQILEEWLRWMQIRHKELFRIIKGNSGENGKLRDAIFIVTIKRLSEQTTHFAEFLCRKYHVPLDNGLRRYISRDKRLFLKNLKIEKLS